MREPIHPGKTLREDLDAPGMSTAELARRIEVPVNRITASSGPRATSGSTSRSSTELRLAERENTAAIARLPTLDAATDLRTIPERLL